MAYIKTLKSNELINGQDNSDVYPVTSTQAVFSQDINGQVPSGVKQRLEDRLIDHEDDSKDLHKEAEKLVAGIECVEIGNPDVFTEKEFEVKENTSYHIAAQGYLEIDTFGDKDSMPVLHNSNTMEIQYGSAIIKTVSDKYIDYDGFQLVGVYQITYTAGYNNLTKTASAHLYLNLRKYFGYATNTPQTWNSVVSLGASHFSNSVDCTVTLPANGSTGVFKYAFFVIPANMVQIGTDQSNNPVYKDIIVTQPDAMDAPFSTYITGTVTRTIGSNTYTYVIYKSDEMIDSHVDKRLSVK